MNAAREGNSGGGISARDLLGVAMRLSFWSRAVLWVWVMAGALALSGCGEDKVDTLMTSARAYLAKSEPKPAIIQLKSALQQQPDLAEARFLLGLALLNSDDASAAVIELRKALKLKHPADLTLPPLARALLASGSSRELLGSYASTELVSPVAAAELKTAIATAYLRLGDKARANAALQEAFKQQAGYVGAQLVQAQLLAADNKFEPALNMLNLALKQTPEDPAAWQLRAELLNGAKAEPALALEAYRHALRLRPDWVAAHVGALSMLLAQRDLSAAKTQLEAMKKALPNHRQTLYFETVLGLQRGDPVEARRLADRLLSTAPANPDLMRLAGSAALQMGDLPRAETMFTNALQAAPGNALVRRLLTLSYLRSAQPNMALATIQPLLDKAAPDAETLRLAATVHLQSGNIKKAEALFAAASKMKPDDVRARNAIALSQLDSASPELAATTLREIAASDTGNTVDVALVSLLMQRKEFDNAIKAIDALERKQPGLPLSIILRGRVQMQQGDSSAARNSFERAVAMAPTHFSAYAALAELDLRAKQPEAAKQRFEALLKLDPKNVQAIVALAALSERSSGSKEEVNAWLAQAVNANPNEPKTRVLLIDRHLQNKDLKLALAAAEEGLTALPSNAQVLDALGRVRMALADYAQAAKVFKQVASLQPASPLAQFRLAAAQLAMKDKTAGAESLNRALALQPGFEPALRTAIELHLATGRNDAALTLARNVQRLQPNDALGYVYEAGIFTRLQKWEAASLAYRAGLRKAPTDSDLAVRLHGVLLQSPKAGEAGKFAEAWQREHPKDAMFLTYVGETALAQKDYAKAESKLLIVADLLPSHAATFNNLAWLRLQLKKPGGTAFAEKANSLAPDNPAFMDTLAMLLARDGQLARAKAVQQKAVALRPDAASLRLNLARLYISAGDKPQAREELERLAKSGEKDSALRLEVGQMLQAL